MNSRTEPFYIKVIGEIKINVDENQLPAIN
jgi:hypothetical protein